jgi:hypothetical protein
VGAVLKFSCPHAGEEVDVLFDGPVSIRAFPAGLGKGAPVLSYLIGGKAADICLAFFNQPYGELVKLLEIIGCVKEAIFPVETEPADILYDGIHKFKGFTAGIGIIHTEITGPAILGGNTEIQAYRFGMAYMKVTIGLGGKAGSDPSSVLVRLQVVIYNLTYKVGLRRGVCLYHVG